VWRLAKSKATPSRFLGYSSSPEYRVELDQSRFSFPFKPIRARPALLLAEYFLQSRANKESASGTLGKETQAPSGHK